MIYLKPDGRIEYVLSGCCCPPDQIRAGLHTAGFTHWFSVNEGAWQPVPLHQDFQAFVRESKSVAEFLENLNGI